MGTDRRLTWNCGLRHPRCMKLLRANGRILGLQATLVRMLVVCLAFRALIPTGFMPDFAADAAGEIKLVLCSEHGLLVDADATGSSPQQDGAFKATGDMCVFAALAALATPQQQGVTLPLVVFDSAHRTDRWAAAPLQYQRGPVLGARAPPLLL